MKESSTLPEGSHLGYTEASGLHFPRGHHTRIDDSKVTVGTPSREQRYAFSGKVSVITQRWRPTDWSKKRRD